MNRILLSKKCSKCQAVIAFLYENYCAIGLHNIASYKQLVNISFFASLITTVKQVFHTENQTCLHPLTIHYPYWLLRKQPPTNNSEPIWKPVEHKVSMAGSLCIGHNLKAINTLLRNREGLQCVNLYWQTAGQNCVQVCRIWC